MSPAPTALIAADRREGQSWTRGQAVKNLAIVALVRAALAVTRPLPSPVLRALGRALAFTAFFAIRSARRIALENLALALPGTDPDARRALARRAYAELGAHLGDTIAMLHDRDVSTSARSIVLSDEGRNVMAAACDEGRGVVFASAHLGPWEHVASALAAAGVPLTIIARESYDPRLSALYERLRTARGIPMIFRGERTSAVRILRTLRAGRVLGIPMDLASRVPSIDVPFLGQPARTPVGPARIALRTRAAVVVGSAAPSSRGTGLAITMTRIETAGLSADDDGERALTERINEELSRRILAYPEGWVWMHPRFARTR